MRSWAERCSAVKAKSIEGAEQRAPSFARRTGRRSGAEEGYAVGLERVLVRDEREPVLERVRDEQAVEGIAVVPRKRAHAQRGREPELGDLEPRLSEHLR